LHALLLFDFHFGCDSANLEKIHDLKQVVARASQRFEPDFGVGRVEEVSCNDLVVQTRVAELLYGQCVVCSYFRAQVLCVRGQPLRLWLLRVRENFKRYYLFRQ
jgi:hypothetical protein